MKKYLLTTLALGFAADLPAADFDFNTNTSPVDAVRLYDRGARVERPLRLNIPEGRHQLVIKGLTGRLDRESLQLIGLPDAVRVLEVTPAGRLVKDDPSPRIKEINDQIRKLRLRVEDESDGIEIIDRELSRLSRYQEVARKAISERTVRVDYKAGELEKTLKFLESRQRSLSERRRGHEREIRDLNEKIQLAHRNLSEERPGSRNVTDVRIMVEANSRWSGESRLTYVVNDAHWTPVYEARGKTDSLRLAIGARVNQSSGEDWTNVKLTFSTARPSLGASAPNLAHPRLVFHEVDPDRSISIGSVLKEAKALDREMADMPANNPAMSASRVQKAGVNVVLLAQGRASVTSGARPSRVGITGYDLDATVEWVAIPRLNPRVFRRLTAKNTTGHPLIGGEVHLFQDGRFLGYSSMKHRGVNQKLNLSLGQDSKVKIRRYRDASRTKSFKEGTFTSSKKGTVSWIIELKNEGESARTVNVLDHAPVSEIDGVDIEVTSHTSEPTVKRDDGILSWKVELDPGETRTIRFEYEITVPGGMNMSLPTQ